MGILSGLKAVGKAIISKAGGKVVSKSNPVSTFVSEIPSVQGAGSGAGTRGYLKPVKEGIAKGVKNIVSNIVSNPIKSLTAVAVGVPLGVGFLSTSGGREVVKSIPSKAKETGEKIGNIAGGEQPLSDLNVSDVVKTAGIVGGATALVGAGVLAVDKYLDSRKEDSVLGTDDTIPQETGGTTPSVVNPPIPANSPIATTPQGILTENISPSKSKKSRRRAVKTTPSPIVRVNNKVIVNNKNYLKGRA